MNGLGLCAGVGGLELGLRLSSGKSWRGYGGSAMSKSVDRRLAMPRPGDKPVPFDRVYIACANNALNLCTRCGCLVDPRYWEEHTRVCTDKEY